MRWTMSRRDLCSGILGAGAALVLPGAGALADDNPFAAVDAVLDARIRHTKGRGLLAIAHRRRLVHVAGFGMDRTSDYPIFSISKSVTGLALATLAQDGRLSFDDTLERHLGALMKRLGPPVDPRFAGIAIRQVVTHTAGLLSSTEDDALMSRREIARIKGDRRSVRREDVLALILKQKLPRAPGESYAYSNMGYLVLGAVVEAAAGQPYEDYCRARVLKPLGLTRPAIDPDLRYGDSYLGRRMTAPEVLRLLEAYEENDARVLGPAMHEFAGTPHDSWINEQKTSFYSLGVFARRGASGSLAWWNNGLGQGAGLGTSISTLASRGSGGVSAVWMVAPRLERDKYYDFDRAVWRPLREIKTWPDRNLYPEFGL